MIPSNKNIFTVKFVSPAVKSASSVQQAAFDLACFFRPEDFLISGSSYLSSIPPGGSR